VELQNQKIAEMKEEQQHMFTKIMVRLEKGKNKEDKQKEKGSKINPNSQLSDVNALKFFPKIEFPIFDGENYETGSKSVLDTSICVKSPTPNR